MKKFLGTVSAAALVLAAGAVAPGLAPLSAALSSPAYADEMTDPIQVAINAPDRPEKDRARDEGRKPAEVLAFAGVKPGMTVLDVDSATGWYTELLSRVVGPEGKVYAHNGAGYMGYFKDKVGERYKDGHLKNVTEMRVPDSELFDLPEGSVDVATMMLVFHDYYLKGEPEDLQPMLASLKKALKPGGTVIIVDHIAPAGMGKDSAEKLHRIDPAIVKAEMEAAGFKLVASSDVLMNPDDPLDKAPWAEGLRGHTSRFVYKFAK